MPQDAFTLRYLCEELNSIFAGGKINRIVQPDNDEVIWTVYTGKKTEKLSLCVNPATPRIGIVNVEKQSPLTAPNFCMLLRKHLLSATIDRISLVGFDRIVKIELTPSSEYFDDAKKTLYVELMGRYSNVILTENGKILGGNRGINVFDNGVRPLFVGKDYLFPPVNYKKLPSDKSLIDYFNSYTQGGIAQYICAGVQGVALSTAQEIERFFCKIHPIKDQHFGYNLFTFCNKFLFNTSPLPCVITQNGEIKDVCVYPYKTIEGEVLPFDCLWQAEQYYFTERENAKLFKGKIDRARSLVLSVIKKLKKKMACLCAKEKEALLAEENKIFGELILANIYNIKQGQSSCVCYNYYTDLSVEIPLDKKLSPSKNAENYFKKYNKQKRTLLMVLPQKEAIQTEIDYYNSILDEIEICENIQDTVNLYLELENCGIIKNQNQKAKTTNKQNGFREYLIDGFTVLIGKNNTDNDRLTFTAKPDDLWLHVKDYHSAHVIIKAQNGRDITDNVIYKSASICAYYSKCRESGRAEVVYTQKRHVKKSSKAKPGFCVYDNFKSIIVEPDKCVEFLKTE